MSYAMETEVKRELKSITRTRRVVDSMLWLIAAGAIIFSLMTGTPFVAEHSQWKWTGWILPGVVDSALVLSLSADSILSRHGVKTGKWPTVFRWLTAVASLFLNCWSSLSSHEWTSAVVHSIAPLILVCAAEVSPVYRSYFRRVELSLLSTTEEFTVTRAVKKSGRSREDSSTPKIGEGSTPVESIPLTTTQEKIRQAFMAGKKAREAAEETGVSTSYVYSTYKRIREELEKAA